MSPLSTSYLENLYIWNSPSPSYEGSIKKKRRSASWRNTTVSPTMFPICLCLRYSVTIHRLKMTAFYDDISEYNIYGCHFLFSLTLNRIFSSSLHFNKFIIADYFSLILIFSSIHINVVRSSRLSC